MNEKTSALFCIGIALICAMSGREAITQHPAHAVSSQPAAVFVPLPKDINCSANGLAFKPVAGGSSHTAKRDGAVTSLTCWAVGTQGDHKKEIPLASSNISRGLLSTEDFGDFQITPMGISIHPDKLASLRAFLQTVEAPPKPEEYSEVDPQELKLDIEGRIMQVEMGADGNLAVLNAVVTSFKRGSKDIGLKSNSVTIDEDDKRFGALLTDDLGKVRLQFNSSGGMSIWLTPSQKKKLMEMPE